MHFYCYSGAPNADAPDVYQFITLSPRTSMPQRRELWGELKLSSRPCSSTWTRGSTRYSEVCFSDKSIYMHTALMAQTTAFLVPGSSHSVTVTNLVILLFESQGYTDQRWRRFFHRATTSDPQTVSFGTMDS